MHKLLSHKFSVSISCTFAITVRIQDTDILFYPQMCIKTDFHLLYMIIVA